MLSDLYRIPDIQDIFLWIRYIIIVTRVSAVYQKSAINKEKGKSKLELNGTRPYYILLMFRVRRKSRSTLSKLKSKKETKQKNKK